MKAKELEIRDKMEHEELMRLMRKCECSVRFARSIITGADVIWLYMLDACGRSCELCARFSSRIRSPNADEVAVA